LRAVIMSRTLYILTDFGDAAVTLPLAGAVLCWLAWRASRLAAWWALSVALCVGLTAATKIYFYGCPPVSDIRSPSGHTALSVLVYGALAMMAAWSGGTRTRLAPMIIGAALIVTIAVSRLVLNAHSVPEVVLGLAIGAASLALFGGRYRCSVQAKVWPLLIATGLLMIVLHGQQLHAEEFLHRLTGYLQIQCG
jgi:membrane-associated phospholipid phosphatase